MRMRMRMRKLLLIAVLGLAGCAGHPSPAPDTPVAVCSRNLANWLQRYADTGTDLGDYQEMGLSSAEGAALRDLERQAAALKSRGPLPSGWITDSTRASCTAIAATAHTTPGAWP